MKKLVLPILVLTLFSFSKDTSKLTDAERAMVITHLEETRDHLQKVISGLSKEQLNFRAEEDSWTIAECVEHLAIAENAFGSFIEKALATPPNPAMRDSLKMKDEDLMGLITDRSKTFKTAEPFEPTGKFGSFEESVNVFLTKRKEHIEFVRTTQEDLRNRFNNDLPFGLVDGVQVLIFAAGHSERHVLQMEEVMAHKLFPK